MERIFSIFPRRIFIEFFEFRDQKFMTYKFSMSEFSNSIMKNQHFFINMKPTLNSAMKCFLACSAALTSTQERIHHFYIKYSRVSTIRSCQSKEYLEA